MALHSLEGTYIHIPLVYYTLLKERNIRNGHFIRDTRWTLTYANRMEIPPTTAHINKSDYRVGIRGKPSDTA